MASEEVGIGVGMTGFCKEQSENELERERDDA